jgi:hypothetical protein
MILTVEWSWHAINNCRIFRPVRRTFSPEKCDLNSNCVLYAEG